MVECDALIVGGGPAGSSCAAALQKAGWHVIVADRARFPRDKVCAGWVTPEVFQLLDLEPEEYRSTGATLQAITGFRTGVIGAAPLETRYPHVVSYAIRRCEFDAYLLRRAGATVHEGIAVERIRRARDRWVVNDEFEARVLVGAGGHFCPVARHLRGAAPESMPVIAEEVEFPLSEANTTLRGDTPELFFCPDLDGYGWCVRKGNFLNVGFGRRDRSAFKAQLRAFVCFLRQTGRVADPAPTGARWRGHAYLAQGAGTRPLVADGALLVGDAAGLAWPTSGEGIRPAVEAGLLAARTLIEASGRHAAEDLRPYEIGMRSQHPPVARPPKPVRLAQAVVGRALLRSRRFTRDVLLDRWFLQRAVRAPSA